MILIEPPAGTELATRHCHSASVALVIKSPSVFHMSRMMMVAGLVVDRHRCLLRQAALSQQRYAMIGDGTTDSSMSFFGSCTDIARYAELAPGRLKHGKRRSYSPAQQAAAGLGRMGSGSSFQRHRSGCYHSADDLTGDHLYEELPAHSVGPPKLAPRGGVFFTKGKVVLRPIPFKPVLPIRNVSKPARQDVYAKPVTTAPPGGPDDSYSSDDSKHYSTSSQNSYRSEKSQGYGSSDGATKDSRVSGYSSADLKDLKDVSSLSFSRLSHLADYPQTPACSDSGVSELEVMLKDKDTELNHLRTTMEQNEQVIFRVYEEKEHAWQCELQHLRDEYDEKVTGAQQKSFKVEQGLLLQIYQLQQERREARAGLERACEERETLQTRCCEYEQELTALRSHLDETKWAMCQKSGEIGLLKSQLKETNTDTCSRKTEALTLRTQLRDARARLADVQREQAALQAAHDAAHGELHDARAQLDIVRRDSQTARSDTTLDRQRSDAAIAALRKEIDHMRIEADRGRCEADTQRARFEEERQVWSEEKEKVLRYQKQLQLNYVQIFRKNRSLEHEVEQLTLELESRDISTLQKDLFNGLEEVDESQC
ncbi:PREDICTED: leucine zipper putative tumor suppressor 2 homolog [Priapulus caudatus]|uniref:Leucine zipper putative tumor suppressor 2 homolog n=1 Tax=Priapulus caudatus TaxID=37621 RepID=A0ABM1E8L9_PRICU|nr:PREDICTED: leucine zipper putative tumor suppressor 2 homolog [Priapulus caudatus]